MVLPWPAQAALKRQQEHATLFVISITTVETNDRRAARRQIRTALAEALGVLLGSDPSHYQLDPTRGKPPRLQGTTIGVSISHESGLSVAAINLHGAVGIDIVRRDIVAAAESDWTRLAHDYLGPTASKRIASCDSAQGPDCFASEWTTREARLKCSGSALVEWFLQPDALSQYAARTLDLAMPYIGTLVVDSQRL